MGSTTGSTSATSSSSSSFADLFRSATRDVDFNLFEKFVSFESNVDTMNNEFTLNKDGNLNAVNADYSTIIQIKVDEINQTESPLAQDILRSSKGIIEGFELIARQLSKIDDTLELVASSIFASAFRLEYALYDFISAQSSMLYDIKESIEKAELSPVINNDNTINNEYKPDNIFNFHISDLWVDSDNANLNITN